MAEHAEIGEGRFTPELHPEDQSVWYELCAFSRPQRAGQGSLPLVKALAKTWRYDGFRKAV